MTERKLVTLLRAYGLSLLARAADAATIVVVFGELSVAEAGVFSHATAIAAFFWVALDIGVSEVLLRRHAQTRQPLLGSVWFAVRMRAPVIMVSAVVLLYALSTGRLSSGASWAVAFSCVAQVLSLPLRFYIQVWRGSGRQSLANGYLAAEAVVRLSTASTVAALANPAEAWQVAGAWGMGQALLSVTCIAHAVFSTGEAVPRGAMRLMGREHQAMARSAISFLALAVLGVIQNRLDWLLVDGLVGGAEVANYALANRVYEILVAAVGVGVVTTYPWTCRRIAGGEEDIAERVGRAGLAMFGITAAFVGGVWIPAVLETLWDGKYAAGAELSALMIPVAAASTLVMLGYYEMLARGLERITLSVAAAATIVQVGVCLSTIEEMGAMGAVLGMASLSVVSLLGYTLWGARQGLIAFGDVTRVASYVGGVSLGWVAARAEAIPVIWGGLAVAVLGASLGWLLILGPPERAWIGRRLQVRIGVGGGTEA